MGDIGTIEYWTGGQPWPMIIAGALVLAFTGIFLLYHRPPTRKEFKRAQYEQANRRAKRAYEQRLRQKVHR